MYTDIVQWNRIRRSQLCGGVSQAEAARKNGMSRVTIRKILSFPSPPGYRRAKPIRRPKLDSYARMIDEILVSDAALPKKCRNTAKKIYERLRAQHGFQGSYTIIKDYVRESRARIESDRVDVRSKRHPDEALDDDPAQITYSLIKSLPRRQAIGLLRTLFDPDEEEAQLHSKKLESLLGRYPRRKTVADQRLRKRQVAFDWMRNVLQGAVDLEALAADVGQNSDLQKLRMAVLEGGLSTRNRALAVLARMNGISSRTIQRFLNISRATVLKYGKCYESGGMEALMARERSTPKKSAQECYQNAVIALLHSPPSEHGINRTTWKMDDLRMVLRQQDQYLCKDGIRAIFDNAGYKWRKARVVLTSRDPEYRSKVEAIQKILAELDLDEAFFSIDEYGPFAVKMKPGRKRVGPHEIYTVPQWQKSKGWMILTAALELSKNQVTHFYSKKKNTDEMIRLVDVLREGYKGYETLYLSWDAASWHVSKKLEAYLAEINENATRGKYPVVKTAPLPAGAQFLNVIESVFSGMAKAVIHNSNYPSVEAVQSAINRYYSDRNAHFLAHPKRAGKKIWGGELVPSTFAEGQNCKDPKYR